MANRTAYFRLKTSYEADMALCDTPGRQFALCAFIAGLLILPFAVSSYAVHLANLVFINVMVALALNLVTGYAGMISLGHAALFAAGGYTVAILGAEAASPPWLAVPAATAAGALIGAIMGLPALRLRAIYFVVGTLAMHYAVMYAGNLYQQLAGFPWGISVPPAKVGPLVIDDPREWYFVLLAALGATTVFCLNLARSKIGRIWMACRERDVVAQALGLRVGYHKVVAFAVSGAITGLAGSLNAYYVGFITAESFTISLAVSFLAMIAIGGLASIEGSYLGALLVTLLPFGLREVMAALSLPPSVQAHYPAVEMIVFGMLMAAFVILEPEGLSGIWTRIKSYFELWPFRYRRAISTAK